MGTFASLTLPQTDAATLDAAADTVMQVFDAVEQRFSVYRPDSDLRRLAAQAGGEGLALDGPTVDLIRQALVFAESTQGTFDPTVGPLLSLWGFREPAPVSIPEPEAFAAALRKVGWQQVAVYTASEDSRTIVRLKQSGMQLDLGGIAKGHALDQAFDALVAAGLTDFMIDLGGELRCLGRPHPTRDGWRIGVRHPFKPQAVIGALRVSDGLAIATSGHYERFREIEGRRYAHIIDPRDGYPVAGMAGVTVLASNSIAADALSTALFVMGLEEGPVWLRDHPGVEALFVPDRQPLEMHATAGMAKRFQPMPAYARKLHILAPETAAP